ncbi:MAG: hypothetical protein LBK95_19845 [Bifidobacteriaceae bacterium]|jgi:hypothetical protein|nr:hypothetical protein [Bifidobacteriaceae bacterium]
MTVTRTCALCDRVGEHRTPGGSLCGPCRAALDPGRPVKEQIVARQQRQIRDLIAELAATEEQDEP